VDDIPEPVLQDLYVFVKTLNGKSGEEPPPDNVVDDEDYKEPSSSKAASTHRKKNKPMSAREQESKIAQVKQQLSRFNNQSGSDQGNGELFVLFFLFRSLWRWLVSRRHWGGPKLIVHLQPTTIAVRQIHRAARKSDGTSSQENVPD
jgi:hypothetical protein